jgi:hypothetical protein
MKGELTSAAMTTMAVKALMTRFSDCRQAPRQAKYPQDSCRRLRFQRHEDNPIQHLPGLVGSLPSPVETVEDRASEDEVGHGADCWPEDHHRL